MKSALHTNRCYDQKISRKADNVDDNMNTGKDMRENHDC